MVVYIHPATMMYKADTSWKNVFFAHARRVNTNCYMPAVLGQFHRLLDMSLKIKSWYSTLLCIIFSATYIVEPSANIEKPVFRGLLKKMGFKSDTFIPPQNTLKLWKIEIGLLTTKICSIVPIHAFPGCNITQYLETCNTTQCMVTLIIQWFIL